MGVAGTPCYLTDAADSPSSQTQIDVRSSCDYSLREADLSQKGLGLQEAEEGCGQLSGQGGLPACPPAADDRRVAKRATQEKVLGVRPLQSQSLGISRQAVILKLIALEDRTL